MAARRSFHFLSHLEHDMNVTFSCPKCDHAQRVHFSADSQSIDCSHCKQPLRLPERAVVGQRVCRCIVCPSTDLYVRKDFPQRLGVALVVAGILGSCVAWYYTAIYWTYGILFGTALIDVVLFTIVGNALMCYRCHAQYRGVQEMESHGAFSLETHERYRQLTARTSEQ